MLRSITFAFILFAITTGTAAYAQVQLNITVANVREVRGSVRVGLFSSSGDFPKDAAYGKVVSVHADTVTVTFSDLPPGTYAISVIHDKNGNGKLDMNILGIPREGFAFGNNAMGMFGPPSFEKASVTLGDTMVTQELQLKHF